MVEEPSPLVSVTCSTCSVCQKAGCWMSHCLRAASTTHGFVGPLPLRGHGGDAVINSYAGGQGVVGGGAARSHPKTAVYSPGRKVFTRSTQEQRTCVWLGTRQEMLSSPGGSGGTNFLSGRGHMKRHGVEQRAG